MPFDHDKKYVLTLICTVLILKGHSVQQKPVFFFFYTLVYNTVSYERMVSVMVPLVFFKIPTASSCVTPSKL